MHMRLTRFAAAVVFALVARPAFAEDKDTYPNPEFGTWSKCKAGTSVTLKTTTDAAGMKSELLMTNTLVEVGADKLVIETTNTIKVNGMEIKTPAQKREITKTIMVPKGVKKDDPANGKPKGTTEEGTETLKVAGMEVKTKWYKAAVEVAGVKSETKHWVSDDVPGMVVKSVTTTTGAVNSTTTMELIEIKKP
jgi:hypothetical protein